MRRQLLITTVFVALVGTAACSDGSDSGGTETEPAATSSPAAETTETAPTSESVEGTDIDPRLEVLVGTWEADPEEVGPHGSTLQINEDGTASLLTFANQHGAYEGEIILGSANPHRFEGTEPETESTITVELAYDADADTLTLDYPGDGGAYVHTRA